MYETHTLHNFKKAPFLLETASICPAHLGQGTHCTAQLWQPWPKRWSALKPSATQVPPRASASLSARLQSFPEERRAPPPLSVFHSLSPQLFTWSATSDSFRKGNANISETHEQSAWTSSKAVPSKEMEIPFPIWYRQL